MISDPSSDVRRLCAGLRPCVLDRMGLSLAIMDLLREFREYVQFEIVDSIDDIELESISPPVAISVYRILQESLNNIVKHAEAKHVAVSLVCNDDLWRLKLKTMGSGLPGKGNRTEEIRTYRNGGTRGALRRTLE